MTPKPKPPRTCPECRFDGGWHFSDDGKSFRCPNYLAADSIAAAHAQTVAANEQATEAARRIITDACYVYIEFSANDLHDQMEAANVPGPVVGAAFTWAATPTATDNGPLIETTHRRVPSRKDGTRHGIYVWRSLVHRAVVAAGGDAA